MLILLVLIWLLVKFLGIFELLFYAVNLDKLIARNVDETTMFQTNTILLYDYINYERERVNCMKIWKKNVWKLILYLVTDFDLEKTAY